MCGQQGIEFCKKIQNLEQSSPKAGDTHVEFQKLSITGLQNCVAHQKHLGQQCLLPFVTHSWVI